MNADEFIASINKHAPPDLRHADREFLRRHEVILGSGPYYQEHIPKAISLLRMEHEFLGKVGQKPKKSALVRGARPPVAISQIIVIHNFDAEQCHRIRNGLIQTGLINFEGLIYVNFSPFTHCTIESLPEDAFKDADYHMEYSVFNQADSEGKTSPLGAAVNPVLFIKDVDPTPVQLSFVYGGQRPPAMGRRSTLPSPLYQAFLNIYTDSTEAIMDFMNTYKVYLFPMHYDPAQLSDYIAGIDGSLKLGLVATEVQLKAFWDCEQQKMRGVLAAAQGKLGQVVFPLVFPVSEEAVVEWREISGYFDPEFMKSQHPENAKLALFEFRGDMNSETRVRVRRYYGWLDYMWVELVDDMYVGKAALICERCGKVIVGGARGRQKRFCSRVENEGCYLVRKAGYVDTSRKE